MSKEKQRQFDEINRPRNEELFNNIHKQYQELAKVKTKDEQIEKDELQEFVITLSDCQHRYDKECIKAIVTKSPLPKENKFYAKYLMEQGYRRQSEPISCGHENGGEWISVEERLPNTNENVLVYVKGFPCFVYTYMGGNEWEDDYGYWHRTEDANVTHWMPLPEAPKMKGGVQE